MNRMLQIVVKPLLVLLALNVFASSLVSGHEIRPAYLKLTEVNGGFSEIQAQDTDADADEGEGEGEGEEAFSDLMGYEVVWKQPIRSGERLQVEPELPLACREVARGLGENTKYSLVHRWKVNCSEHGLQGKTIAISGLDNTLVDAFVEIVFVDGGVQSHILKPGSSSFTVENSGRNSDIVSYLRLGVEHLLQGFDHILFIIGLVLLVRTPLNLVKVVTSFTIAHSLTLALATFGIVNLSQASVEAVIALSIMFLGVELVQAQFVSERFGAGSENQSIMQRYPWAITFVFGLLHGFGFAGALTEIGLPQEAAIWALLFFNIGVEIGQLIIVAGMLVLFAILTAAKVNLPLMVKRIPIYGIGTLAGFWFVERSLNVLQLT